MSELCVTPAFFTEFLSRLLQTIPTSLIINEILSKQATASWKWLLRKSYLSAVCLQQSSVNKDTITRWPLVGPRRSRPPPPPRSTSLPAETQSPHPQTGADVSVAANTHNKNGYNVRRLLSMKGDEGRPSGRPSSPLPACSRTSSAFCSSKGKHVEALRFPWQLNQLHRWQRFSHCLTDLRKECGIGVMVGVCCWVSSVSFYSSGSTSEVSSNAAVSKTTMRQYALVTPYFGVLASTSVGTGDNTRHDAGRFADVVQAFVSTESCCK